jgi:hypothetical protein
MSSFRFSAEAITAILFTVVILFSVSIHIPFILKKCLLLTAGNQNGIF